MMSIKINPIDKQVISVYTYWNEICNSRLRPLAKTNKKLVCALLARGYTVEDMELVVRFKYAQWAVIQPMRRYLRPKTLYDVYNFPKYLEKAKQYFNIDSITT